MESQGMAGPSESTDPAAQAPAASSYLLTLAGLRSLCPIMGRLFTQIENLARSEAPVLIQGESGTGKQRIARALHLTSARRVRPLTTLVCTARSAAQLESLLCSSMGRGRPGATLLQEARGGTLVLRDLAALDLQAQAVLLRALDSEPSLVPDPKRATRRVRLITTSGQDVVKLIKQGRFRVDLYYRLVAVRLQVPSLRQRRADIPSLAKEALQQAAQALDCAVPQLDPRALELLVGYSWPGNVRELFHVLEQALLRLRGRAELRPADLSGLLYATEAPPPVEIPIGSTLGEAERQVILQTLAAHQGSRQATADTLSISRRTLYEKLARYKSRGDASPPIHDPTKGLTPIASRLRAERATDGPLGHVEQTAPTQAGQETSEAPTP